MLVMYRCDLFRDDVYFYKWVVTVSQSIEGWDQAKEREVADWVISRVCTKMAIAKVIELSES